jgi:hypothetical protein
LDENGIKKPRIFALFIYLFIYFCRSALIPHFLNVKMWLSQAADAIGLKEISTWEVKMSTAHFASLHSFYFSEFYSKWLM